MVDRPLVNKLETSRRGSHSPKRLHPSLHTATSYKPTKSRLKQPTHPYINGNNQSTNQTTNLLTKLQNYKGVTNMILISGTTIEKEALPLNDIMNYAIETTPQFLGIKLKTVANSPVCLGVYLHVSLTDQYPISDEVLPKLHYFNDDNHLISLLENGGKEVELEQEPHDELELEVPQALTTPSNEDGDDLDEQETQPDHYAPTEIPTVALDEGFPSLQVIETVDVVDVEDSNILLEIPDLVSMDITDLRLEQKDEIIKQKDIQLDKHKKALDELYQLQDIQLSEMRAVYESKINEANDALATAEEKLKSLAIPDEYQSIVKYVSYMKNPKALLRDGFTEQEHKRMGTLTSKVHIFAMGPGDSLQSFNTSFNEYLTTNPNALVVDFTGDPNLCSRYKIQTRESSINLIDATVPIETLTRKVGLAELIPTTSYNDISLLGIDWAHTMKKLNAYAGGRQIILLFGDITSFPVKYTVSKLGTIGALNIFVKCNPVILNSFWGSQVFIPAERYRIVALNYIAGVRGILEHFAKHRKVIAVQTQIDWGKLGLK